MLMLIYLFVFDKQTNKYNKYIILVDKAHYQI